MLTFNFKKKQIVRQILRTNYKNSLNHYVIAYDDYQGKKWYDRL